jgi:uncharacterized protein (TIGR00375 family)
MKNRSGMGVKPAQPAFLDLHVHIGRDGDGHAVKITASSQLTLPNILKECVERKGIDIVGIVDCGTAGVLQDLKALVTAGELVEQSRGGFRYRDKLTLIGGVELETVEANGGRAHQLCFFPSLTKLEDFARYIWQKVKNNRLSSQVCYLSAYELFRAVQKRDGFMLPAHVFTPYKSIYGNCAPCLTEVFGDVAEKITALELGLSADRDMALLIPELRGRLFLANSDAHSLEKIGREYNLVSLETPSYEDLVSLFKGRKGALLANYGLDPRLGKYHRSFCHKCGQAAAGIAPPVFRCPFCGEKKNFVVGVLDKIISIGAGQQGKGKNKSQEQDKGHQEHNAVLRSDQARGERIAQSGKYYYQIPLEFIPGLGRKTREKLLAYFKTEMNILHHAAESELREIAGEKVAHLIIKGRRGELQMVPGAGGIYGRIKDSL